MGHPFFDRDGDRAIAHRICEFHDQYYVDAREHEPTIDQALNLCGMSIDTFWRIKRVCPDLAFSCYSLLASVGRGPLNERGYCADFSTVHQREFGEFVTTRGFVKYVKDTKPRYIRGAQMFDLRIDTPFHCIHYDGFVITWPRVFIYKYHDTALLDLNVYQPHEIYADGILDRIEANPHEINRDLARKLCANQRVDFDTFWNYACTLHRIKQARAIEDRDLAELRKHARR